MSLRPATTIKIVYLVNKMHLVCKIIKFQHLFKLILTKFQLLKLEIIMNTQVNYSIINNIMPKFLSYSKKVVWITSISNCMV